MCSFKTIAVKGQKWRLLPQKAIYWEEQKTLILSDLHLGKSGHFRKWGIAAPQNVNKKSIDRLQRLVEDLKPGALYILGDLFHSQANREWFQFEEWINNTKNVDIHLIKGNHDLLHESFYNYTGIKIHDHIRTSGFQFMHDPVHFKKKDSNDLLVSGHIHPGVKVSGRGRQSVRLPCFVVSEKSILLPAFGEFTGLHTIKPKETERVFVVVEESVIEL